MPLAAGNAAETADPNIVTLIRGGPRSAIVLRTEEKGSDVNLATLLVADAFRGSFEAAAVLSTDSDLALPIQLISAELGLPVGVLLPSGRYSVELDEAASFKRTINRSHPPQVPASGHSYGRERCHHEARAMGVSLLPFRPTASTTRLATTSAASSTPHRTSNPVTSSCSRTVGTHSSRRV